MLPPGPVLTCQPKGAAPMITEHVDAVVGVDTQPLKRLARRVRALAADAKAIEATLKALTSEHVPQLVAEPGIGPVVAAQL